MGVAPMNNEKLVIRGVIRERAYARREIEGRKFKLKKEIGETSSPTLLCGGITFTSEMLEIVRREESRIIVSISNHSSSKFYEIAVRDRDWIYPILAIEEISV